MTEMIILSGVLAFGCIVLFAMFVNASKRVVSLLREALQTQELYDDLIEANKEAFKHDFVDEGVKYLIFPVKSVYDHLDHQMPAFLHIVVRNYIEKYGDYNVNAEGKTLVVPERIIQERDAKGRFV